MGIRGIENAKDTKRMAAELDRFSDGFEDIKTPEELFSSPEQVTVSPSSLAHLAELAKGAQADVVTLITQTDKPVYAQLKQTGDEYDEVEQCGEALIAPRLEDGIRSRPLERTDPEPDQTVYAVVDESYENPVRTWLHKNGRSFEKQEDAEQFKDAVKADNVAVYEIAARRLEGE
jgi:hypothetical protein